MLRCVRVRVDEAGEEETGFCVYGDDLGIFPAGLLLPERVDGILWDVFFDEGYCAVGVDADGSLGADFQVCERDAVDEGAGVDGF